MKSSVSEKVLLLGNSCINVRHLNSFSKSTHSQALDFQHSSTRRIVNFCIIIPEASLIDTISDTVTIDGIGHLSYPIVLPARRKPLSSFDATLKESIHQTRDPNISPPSENEDPDILILEDSDSLSLQVEQWAVEYTSMFVYAAGPKFYATTMAHILGTAYVKKGLPEVLPYSPPSLKSSH